MDFTQFSYSMSLHFGFVAFDANETACAQSNGGKNWCEVTTMLSSTMMFCRTILLVNFFFSISKYIGNHLSANLSSSRFRWLHRMSRQSTIIHWDTSIFLTFFCFPSYSFLVTSDAKTQTILCCRCFVDSDADDCSLCAQRLWSGRELVSTSGNE